MPSVGNQHAVDTVPAPSGTQTDWRLNETKPRAGGVVSKNDISRVFTVDPAACERELAAFIGPLMNWAEPFP